MNIFPFAPFIMSAEEFLFMLYIIARTAGVLLLSPLLSGRGISRLLLLYISIFTALLLTMSLYPHYHGPIASHQLSNLTGSNSQETIIVIMTIFKELIIGYVIGFCFSLIFEAILLAGETINTMLGFATAQFVNPFTQSFESILSQLFGLTAILIILSLDLHHLFFRILAESYEVIPIGYYLLSPEMINPLISGTGSIFSYAMLIIAIPFLVLTLSTVGLGFIIRSLPELNSLITAIPIRIVIGLITVMITLGLFPSFVEHATLELYDLAKTLLS